jgi:hypothetical protein
VGVVDRLEVVQIDHDDGERQAVAPVAGDFVLQTLEHGAAVAEARQRIGDGGLLEGLLGADAFGDGMGEPMVDLLQIRGALAHPDFQFFLGAAQIFEGFQFFTLGPAKRLGHVVEGIDQLIELIPGMGFDALGQMAGGDGRGARNHLPDGNHEPRRQQAGKPEGQDRGGHQ